MPFVADADEMAIRVFDESRPEKEVRCTFGRCSVVAEWRRAAESRNSRARSPRDVM